MFITRCTRWISLQKNQCPLISNLLRGFEGEKKLSANNLLISYAGKKGLFSKCLVPVAWQSLTNGKNKENIANLRPQDLTLMLHSCWTDNVLLGILGSLHSCYYLDTHTLQHCWRPSTHHPPMVTLPDESSADCKNSSRRAQTPQITIKWSICGTCWNKTDRHIPWRTTHRTKNDPLPMSLCQQPQDTSSTPMPTPVLAAQEVPTQYWWF